MHPFIEHCSLSTNVGPRTVLGPRATPLTEAALHILTLVSILLRYFPQTGQRWPYLKSLGFLEPATAICIDSISDASWHMWGREMV